MASRKWAAILMGPPGSGKTSISRTLATNPAFQVIETGNLLGAEVRLGSPLAQKIQPYQAAGKLVPADLVGQVISAALERMQGNMVLFDGFPRSMEQVDLLFEVLKKQGMEVGAVLIFALDLEVAMKRLSGRRLCPSCGALYNIHTSPPREDGQCDKCGGKLTQRVDDQEEIVRRRFESYERETAPVNEFFRT